MKIYRLRLRNFRSFRDLQTPEFARLNLIAGPNGTGKSSIKDAISLLLTGTATGCETGQGLAGLRSRHGQPDKPWQLNALVETAKGEGMITRTDGEGPRSSRQQLVETLTGVPGVRARACLYSGEILRLDAKGRQRLLLDLAPQQAVEIPSEVAAAIKAILGEEHPSADLATIERLYKAAYEARTVAGRDVAALGSLADPEPPEGLAGFTVTGLEEGRRELDAAIRKVQAELDEARIDATPKTRDAGPERRALATTTARLDVAKSRLRSVPSVEEIRERAAALAAKIAEVGPANEALVARREQLTERVTALRGDEKRARAFLSAMERGGDSPKCPLCEYELGKQRRGKVEERLTARADLASRDAQKVQAELDAVPEPASTAALETEMRTLADHDAARDRAQKEVGDAEAAVSAAEAALRIAEADAGTPGDPDAAAKIEPLSTRLEEGRRRLSVLDEYLGALRVNAANASKRKAAEDRHAALGQLVDALGPGGLRKTVGDAGGLMEFHAALNGYLEGLGFRVDLRPVLDLEDDPLVTVAGHTVPARMLSRSEQIRFSAAFAIACASATGLGIVVVDDFEALDPLSRADVFRLVSTSPHQAFILAVQTDPALREKAAETNEAGGELRMLLFEGGELVLPSGVAKEVA